VSSDPAGTVPSATNPVTVDLTTPTGGTVVITKGTAVTAPPGAIALQAGVAITAPTASTSAPITLVFHLDAAFLPAGDLGGDVIVTRDGTVAGACPNGTAASPDPCISGASLDAGALSITVLTSHASTWGFALPKADRLAGADRDATAVAISQATFPPASASVVVLARDDAYPDALAGGPLAASKDGPVLLTPPTALNAETDAEIHRVLRVGGTVFVVGGTGALSAAVESTLQNEGFAVLRIAGADRFATATAVAAQISPPAAVFETTGFDFADALTAAVAAGKLGGVVVLTSGRSQASATATYLGGLGSVPRYAVGGPAAAADPGATAVVGADRYATAAAVASRFFGSATTVGIATGVAFPDALAAGARLGRLGDPLLLSDSANLSPEDASQIATSTRAELYGGTAALSDQVFSQVVQLLGG
jgi:putative cell wall-binding protein